LALFERLRDLPRPVFLHSSDRARYDVMASEADAAGGLPGPSIGVHAWGGGGIVADSITAAELAEIEHKIGRLQATAGLGASSCWSAS
jgi:hypothetical protein